MAILPSGRTILKMANKKGEGTKSRTKLTLRGLFMEPINVLYNRKSKYNTFAGFQHKPVGITLITNFFDATTGTVCSGFVLQPLIFTVVQ